MLRCFKRAGSSLYAASPSPWSTLRSIWSSASPRPLFSDRVNAEDDVLNGVGGRVRNLAELDRLARHRGCGGDCLDSDLLRDAAESRREQWLCIRDIALGPEVASQDRLHSLHLGISRAPQIVLGMAGLRVLLAPLKTNAANQTNALNLSLSSQIELTSTKESELRRVQTEKDYYVRILTPCREEFSRSNDALERIRPQVPYGMSSDEIVILSVVKCFDVHDSSFDHDPNWGYKKLLVVTWRLTRSGPDGRIRTAAGWQTEQIRFDIY
ncbi:hypothetical protein HD806DRAFT_529341 [Xylariaceae sp. AK1471]|nr:hypothetical protein HD806DRAFT_529341 [Xylariaceae sp. AK1471]